MEIVYALCEECEYAFRLYRLSLVDSRREPKKASDLFFYRYLCVDCWTKRNYWVFDGYDRNIFIQIGRIRYPEFDDNNWIVANIL